MAQSIDKSTHLTSDVYGINEYINKIKKDYTPDVNEETMMLGIFGYTGQVFSDMFQNTIVMASEFSNESIPTKAKFEKNVIAHALGLGITDINAVPAQLDILLTLSEDDINLWANAISPDGEERPWEFVWDKDTKIFIGDFEFHTDYDIMIRKVKLENSGLTYKFAYTAQYIIDIDNPISNVTNPYLTSPVRMNVNGTHMIFTKCTIRQVENEIVYSKVLSDNSIAAKTVTFEFEGQLAAFTVDVTEGDTNIHLVPVYEGLNVEVKKYPYFYYTYLDSNTIRIKFDRSSYAPRINSDIAINIQKTRGEEGNFIYEPDVYPGFAFSSEKYGYGNIACQIRPITGESMSGANKKSIADLKKLIPKEALSRGSITNLADLQNYFNMLNTDNSTMYFYKKRDNALERLYYSFILMRDSYNVIIPTNTIDILVKRQDPGADYKQVIKRGQMIKLNEDGYGELIEPTGQESEHGDNFYYVIPYNFVINTSPLYGMYYLTIMDANKFLDFSYINDHALYQYIATSINWFRGYTTEADTYTMTIDIEQNIINDPKSPDTDNVGSTLRCIAVFYNKDDTPIRWAEGEKYTISGDIAGFYHYRFKFKTDDQIDIQNRISITEGLYDVDSSNPSNAYLWGTTKCVIHMITKQGTTDLNDLDQIVPDLDGYTLSNSYTVIDGIDFFYDYSDIINSVVKTNKSSTGEVTDTYTVKAVPMVKYDYFKTEDKAIDFCNELVKRKRYIDYAILVFEDAFGMDFKFFNTYGPSQLFTLDNETDYLNRTCVSLTFRVRIKPHADTNTANYIIADIKDYIEDINEINTIHMPNLITEITTKYSESIEYFEFVDMNGYGPSKQHLYSMGMPDYIVTPEFINVAALDDGTPDITLIQM